MWKIITIPVFVYFCFIIEAAVAQFSGTWFQPSFLIILVVFFNLFRGTQYSLIVALVGGVFLDSYSVNPFGIHVVALMCAALITTVVKVSFYQVGSTASRVLIVFLVTLASVCVEFVLYNMYSAVTFTEMFVYVLVPRVWATTVIANAVFERLKQCALRLFA